MRRILYLILGVLLLIGLVVPMATPALATETTTVFADYFGTGDDIDNVQYDWDVPSYDDWDVDSDGDSSDAALRTVTNRYLRLQSDDYVEKHDISTTGLENIHLEYTWGQQTDSDTGDDGDLVVQWRLCTETDWTRPELNRHNLVNNSTTAPNANSVDVTLPAAAENTCIDIRFWGDTDEDDDRARVDNVIVSGDPLPPGIHITKTATTGEAQLTVFVVNQDTSQSICVDHISVTITASSTVVYDFTPPSRHTAEDGEIDVDDTMIQNGTFPARKIGRAHV